MSKFDRTAELRPVGAWNQLEIELKGRSIRVTVNGNQIMNFTIDRDVLLPDGGNQALLPDGRVPGLNRMKGRIGLQKHTGAARFRNIEVMELGTSK